MAKPAKQVRDVKTRTEYPSEAAAGRDLAHLVGGDPRDQWVWFKLRRAMPERFEVLNADGEWVPLDHPSEPFGTLHGRDEGSSRTSPATGTRLTTLEIDTGKFVKVKAILGTQTLRETVDRSFDEVLAHAARRQSVARLQSMDGLELDKTKVMEKAWR